MENGVGSGNGVAEGTGVAVGSGVLIASAGSGVASAGFAAGEQENKSGRKKRMQSAAAAYRLESIMRRMSFAVLLSGLFSRAEIRAAAKRPV